MDTSTGLGPQPTRSDTPRQPALRVLRALVASGPATLVELTESLGGHPNTTRVHLEHLITDGFAEEVARPVTGRGRPPRTYSATVSGRQVAVEDPDRDEQSALVEAIAEHLAASPDPVAASLSVGHSWGARLKAAADTSLVSALAAQGFAPIETEQGIELQTCPLLTSARQLPEVVCGIHQGLVDALAPDDQWRIHPFALRGACLIRRGESV